MYIDMYHSFGENNSTLRLHFITGFRVNSGISVEIEWNRAKLNTEEVVVGAMPVYTMYMLLLNYAINNCVLMRLKFKSNRNQIKSNLLHSLEKEIHTNYEHKFQPKWIECAKELGKASLYRPSPYKFYIEFIALNRET